MAEQGVGNEKKSATVYLKGILVFLAVVIVVLIVGIAAVSVNNGSLNGGGDIEVEEDEEEEEDTYAHEEERDVLLEEGEVVEENGYRLPKELMEENLSPEDQVIKDTSIMLQTDVDTEEIEQYYDDVIKKANEEGDTEFAIKIIIQKMGFLSTIEGSCRKASEFVNGIDLSLYSREEVGYLTSYVISLAMECEDEGLKMQWERNYW